MNKILSILKGHNVTVKGIDPDNHQITVTCVYSKDGRAFYRDKVLEATEADVMAWLGY